MESQTPYNSYGPVARIVPIPEGSKVCVVCEHASNRIPKKLGSLGLSDAALLTHIAWDPGALPVAEALTTHLAGGAIFGCVSRLVYDCNRPPEAPSAMPVRSEQYDIPGNSSLNSKARNERTEAVYVPFSKYIAAEIERGGPTLSLLVTIHSFNPVYHGKQRTTEVGLLHGSDDRFARAMLENMSTDFPFAASLNEPYSAADGVAHTLELHGVKNGLLNVMIEIRNDLISNERQQAEMAAALAPWIQSTLDQFESTPG